MTRKLLALACLAGLALAACRQEPPEPAEPVEPVAGTPAPAEPPTLIPTDRPAAGSNFDRKGFAGTFSGTLPCADCPGIDTTLRLGPDGSYVLSETYRDSGQGAVVTEGTWSAEAEGRRIRLDPDSKSDADRLYAISSRDEIAQLDPDGKPIASGLDYSLRRAADTAGPQAGAG